MQIMEYDYLNIFAAPGVTEELSADLNLRNLYVRCMEVVNN